MSHFFCTRHANSTPTAITEQEGILQNKISEQFNNMRSLPYRLYAVFVHAGSVEFGHYYIYIRDFARDVWRKYNDIDVSQVTDVSNEVFGATMAGGATGSSGDQVANDQNIFWSSPPTPYFVVYISDTTKDRLVEPVVRVALEDIHRGKVTTGMASTTAPKPEVSLLSPPASEDGKGATPENHSNEDLLTNDIRMDDGTDSGPPASKDSSSDTLTGT